MPQHRTSRYRPRPIAASRCSPCTSAAMNHSIPCRNSGTQRSCRQHSRRWIPIGSCHSCRRSEYGPVGPVPPAAFFPQAPLLWLRMHTGRGKGPFARGPSSSRWILSECGISRNTCARPAHNRCCRSGHWPLLPPRFDSVFRPSERQRSFPARFRLTLLLSRGDAIGPPFSL